MFTWSELSPSAKDADIRLPNPDTEGGGLVGQKECFCKQRVCPTCWVWKGMGEGNGWKV